MIGDLGAGSGNSTIWLADEYRSLNPKNRNILVALEPSQGGIALLPHKFGFSSEEEWQKFLQTVQDPQTAMFITQQREGASIYPLTAVQAFGEALPLKDDVFDLIHAIQVFHWTNQEKTLAEVRRVLKPGGSFIFDESGLQFDFGDLQNEGIKINNYHYLNHPFHQAFLIALNNVLTKKGLPTLNPKKLDRFHHMFNFAGLEEMLKNADFSLSSANFSDYSMHVKTVSKETGHQLTPFQDPTGKFLGVIDHRQGETLKRFILNGGKMRYFNQPAFSNLHDEEKQAIIKQAFDQTLTENAQLFDLPVAETAVFFIAQKIN